MVVRVAEAVEEEAQVRKLPPVQQKQALEHVLKRFESQLSSASGEQEEAICEAMRVLRSRIDVLRLEEEVAKAVKAKEEPVAEIAKKRDSVGKTAKPKAGLSSGIANAFQKTESPSKPRVSFQVFCFRSHDVLQLIHPMLFER